MSSNPFNPPGATQGNPFAPTTNNPTPAAAPATGGFNATPQNGAVAMDQQTQAAPEIIDFNDPRLTSESLTVQEGDAFSQPAPPPDRKWRVKLKHEGIKQQGSSDILPWEPAIQKDKNGNQIGLFARTVMSVTIQDSEGKYDGLHLQVPFFYMDTKVNREGLSKVMTVLNLLRKPDGTPWIQKGERLNHKELIERFVKALQGEPEVGVESQWELQCEGCNQEAKARGGFAKSIQGMTKFPPSKTVRGEYDPEMRCQVNPAHGYSKARPVVGRFLNLKEVLPK